MAAEQHTALDGRGAMDSQSRGRAAIAGMLAAALALATAELLAGLVDRVPSLVQAVGDGAVDAAPPFLKDFAVAAFGTADKPVLLAGIGVVALLFGVALGVLAARRFAAGAAGIVAFGLVGGLAGASDPQASSALAWASALVAAAVGVVALRLLGERAARANAAAGMPESMPGSMSGTAAPERREFLRWAAAGGALAVTGGAIGRRLSDTTGAVQAQRAAVTLPAPAVTATPRPAGLRLPGLTPLYVPNRRFYRIDTALGTPRVDLDTWRLEVRGLVERPFSLSFAELLDEAMEEHDVTIACVSNEVGGDLVGNARWLGVPLSRLLDRAGVQTAAAQVVGRSVDGFTAAFPVQALRDRTALVAVGMNGEPLPAGHGFPARLVVAGLYGYVSATKWLSSIELADADFQGYWIPRGWAKEAPVKTQSRIDVPRHGVTVQAGRVPIAGVAWAPNRGVERVEVRVDDGDWRQARLSEPIGPDAWRQWVLDWDATPGRHRVQVRATDGDGQTQPERRAPPRPDGATGWHTVAVRVD